MRSQGLVSGLNLIRLTWMQMENSPICKVRGFRGMYNTHRLVGAPRMFGKGGRMDLAMGALGNVSVVRHNAVRGNEWFGN
jgi:hypothetical protein